VYESRPHIIIITLGSKLYRIMDVSSPTVISLISIKKCSKIISQTRKFVFFMIHSQGKGNIVVTCMALVKGSTTQQK